MSAKNRPMVWFYLMYTPCSWLHLILFDMIILFKLQNIPWYSMKEHHSLPFNSLCLFLFVCFCLFCFSGAAPLILDWEGGEHTIAKAGMYLPQKILKHNSHRISISSVLRSIENIKSIKYWHFCSETGCSIPRDIATLCYSIGMLIINLLRATCNWREQVAILSWLVWTIVKLVPSK